MSNPQLISNAKFIFERLVDAPERFSDAEKHMISEWLGDIHASNLIPLKPTVMGRESFWRKAANDEMENNIAEWI